MSVNKALILGNIGKDPELKHTPAGTAVCNFGVATTERWAGQDGKKNEKTTWHNIVAWGRQGEVIHEYLHKGDPIFVEGRIENRSYDDKDGNKKYISEIVLSSFTFIGGKPKDNGSAPSEPPMQNSRPDDDPDLPFDDDPDLPF